MNRAIQILFAAAVLMCMCCGDDTEAEVADHGQFAPASAASCRTRLSRFGSTCAATA